MKLVLAAFAPFYSGAEVGGLRLAQGLVRRGHEVLFVIGHPNPALAKALDTAGVRWVQSRMAYTGKLNAPRYLVRRWRLQRLLRRTRPDLVYSNDLQTHQIVSDAARRCRLPRVCHHRWVWPGPAADWLNKYGAERHIFMSQALRAEMMQGSLTLGQAPSAVVYDGLMLGPLPSREEREAVRRTLGLPAGKLIVLFVGQVIEIKGVADLLHAWQRLPAHLRDRARLVIVGDDLQQKGAYRRRMEKLDAELGTGATFAGFRKDIQSWFVAADVLVVPSHVEPFGLVTLEAMACARPVIGARVGGIPEVLSEGETGLLVPPRSPEHLAAALASLLENEEMRRRFGDNGRQRCERHFSIDAYVDGMLGEYERCLEEWRERVACSGGCRE